MSGWDLDVFPEISSRTMCGCASGKHRNRKPLPLFDIMWIIMGPLSATMRRFFLLLAKRFEVNGYLGGGDGPIKRDV